MSHHTTTTTTNLLSMSRRLAVEAVSRTETESP
jgi:hypothetical protein